MRRELTRRVVLKEIAAELHSLDSFNVTLVSEQYQSLHRYQNAVGHYHRAEALIELLEVLDCGSVGGYDKGQTEAHRRTLRNRYDWLCGGRVD